jgi:hypothetical protein
MQSHPLANRCSPLPPDVTTARVLLPMSLCLDSAATRVGVSTTMAQIGSSMAVTITVLETMVAVASIYGERFLFRRW